MKVTITLAHWDKAKAEDAVHAGMGRTQYCPIWQCLAEMGRPDVYVNVDRKEDGIYEYVVQEGDARSIVTGCGTLVAQTFDREAPLPADLLPCTFELESAS